MIEQQIKKNYKARLIRLSLFIVLFLVVSPFLVFYAMGDVPSGWFNFRKTGGIYLFDFPTGSEIYIDGDLKKVSNFIQRDFFIKNLKPNTSYRLTVKKEGYNEWQKVMRVEPNMVAESAVFTLPSQPVIDEIATTSKSGLMNSEYIRLDKLFSKPIVVDYSKEYGSTTIDLKEKNLTIKRKVAVWSDGREVIARWLGEKGSEPLMFCENRICRNENNVAVFAASVKKLDFYPGRSDAVIVLVAKDVYAVELTNNNTKNVQLVYAGVNKTDFIMDNDNLYIKDGTKIFSVEI